MTRNIFLVALSLVSATACQSGVHVGSAPAAVGPEGKVTPVYNQATGRLDELTADRNGIGKADTRAHMDGARLKYIEIDRNGDGKPDRWEYYTADVSRGGTTSVVFDQHTALVRAEEANGPDPAKITRWEYYDAGVLQRVEEDADNDGRIDTWVTYRNGAVASMDVDTKGTGKPDRRLVYLNGVFDHAETDATGSGVFTRAAEPAAAGRGGNR